MKIAAAEALRIVRSLEVTFPTGPSKTGTAFLAPRQGRLMTCAHVVVNEVGQTASRVIVSGPGGIKYSTKVAAVDRATDLASLESSETAASSKGATSSLELGENVVFAGLPAGVPRLSVFPGMISSILPAGSLTGYQCDLIQVAGMINSGNSGGPMLNEHGLIVGVITSKYVPLLKEIDRLVRDLAGVPQVPQGAGIMGVDFGKFFNASIATMRQIGEVLKLVQVGVGWAVPYTYFKSVGGD